MIEIKCSHKHYPDLLWQWLALKDIYGNTGIAYLAKRGIFFQHKDQEADIGISWHGDRVKGIPKENCILLKTEPPIYNIAYGWNLCNRKYMDKYMAVLSLYKERYKNSYHFMYVCISLLYDYIDKSYFDKPKEEMLCMILRNKKAIYNFSKLIPKLAMYNLLSNYNLKREYDKIFCDLLAYNNYHSYGRGWDNRCFNGSPEDRFKVYEILANHTFTFCPENCCIRGFVTEKPIQAMMCGSIPIYKGPQDVDFYLPEGTYIDLRNFDDPEELVIFLKELTEPEIEWYRDNIRKFINSEKLVEMFSSVGLAKVLERILEEHNVI